MSKGIYIIGTDTDVGKTVVSAGIMYLLLAKGYNACYFKPISSGGSETDEGFSSFDVSFVKAASGFCEPYARINPFRYKTPVSPHLASRIEGLYLDKRIIFNCYKQLIEKYEYIVAEGCGGLAVPLSQEGYMQYQLIKELDTRCILVSRTTIGTINHTLLSISFAEKVGIQIVGIIFSGFCGSIVEQNNIDTIKMLSEVPVLGVIPSIQGIDVERGVIGELREVFNSEINIECMVANV